MTTKASVSGLSRTTISPVSSNYTPGPWRMGNHGQFGTFNPPQIFAEGKEAIAQIYGIPLHQNLEEIDKIKYAEGLANARLIAAAPEMLEALESIRTHVAIYVAANSGAGMKIAQIAQAAISKATGGR